MSRDLIDDLVRGDVVERDEAARDRARLRLRSAIEDETRSARRGRRWLSVIAATLWVAIAILVAQVWLPSGRGGLDPGAATELQRLGEISSNRSASAVLSHQYIYRRYVEVRREVGESVSTGRTYAIDLRVELEAWISSDGSGRTQTTYHEVSFASAQDQANWKEAGTPEIPKVGETVPVNYESGQLEYYRLEELPTDPNALRQALADGKVIESAPGDVNELSTIGTLLAQEDGDGDLRQALFDVAATIPNVTVTTDVVDPLGRPAVELAVTDATGETSLFFDPVDAGLLGRAIAIPEEERPPITQWQAYEQSSIVSRIGDRPEP